MSRYNFTPLRVFIFLGCVIAAISSGALPAHGQGGMQSQKEYCDRQQSILATQSSDSQYLEAISNVRTCRSLAAKSLIGQWNRKHADKQVLELLGRITPLVRDQALFEAAARVASNKEASRTERLSAFVALAGYYNSTISISYTDRIEQPGLSGFSYVWLGRTEAIPTEGLNPLQSDTGTRVLKILSEAARTGIDKTVQSVAQFLSEELPRIK